MRIALGQLNQAVGDIAGNVRRIRAAIDFATDAGAHVLALPELAVPGYPPEDLLLKPSFVRANRRALQEVAAATTEILVIVGFVDQSGDHLFNAAAICQNGAVLAAYHKHLLPNYGVFDERRYFEPGSDEVLVETPEGVLGVSVCEDAWTHDGPVTCQGEAGAQVIVNINASPFHKNKLSERADLLAQRAREADASIVYVNQVGGQDELVFDGGSLVLARDGSIVARLPQFDEHTAVIDVPVEQKHREPSRSMRRITASLPEIGSGASPRAVVAPSRGREEEIYRALCLALSDYVRKNRFEKVVVGLSGGIDSSLTATIAADALGGDSVLGVALPSEFSSSSSVDDAKALAANLEMEMLEVPIAETYRGYVRTLEQAFGRAASGIAEENLQARIRGNILMAISNRYGHLVVATGNKSELACGYATLYGDMAGGFALLKDVFKTEVYALARYRNGISAAIPESVLVKPPSAELHPGQKDSDSLPPYDVLDPILEAYIHQDAPIDEIAQRGHDRKTVEEVVALVDRAEYKRRQAPPGPKVTTKAFGRDRRLPITNLWREGGPFEFPGRAVGENPPDQDRAGEDRGE